MVTVLETVEELPCDIVQPRSPLGSYRRVLRQTEFVGSQGLGGVRHRLAVLRHAEEVTGIGCSYKSGATYPR